MKFQKSIALALVAALLPSLAPASPTLTRKEETRIGREVEREAYSESITARDFYAEAFIAGIVKKLNVAAQIEGFDVRVHVVASPLVNAFTVPGGVIFVTSGIVHAMESEAELAGVIAHEMGHVEGRHIAYRLDKGQSVSLVSTAAVVAAILLGTRIDPKLGQAALAGAIAGAQTKMLSYSRADEDDADRRGARIMEGSGYGRAGLISFMEKLAKLSAMPEEVPAYLFTHPAPTERVAVLKADPRGSATPTPEPDSYFPIFKARVAAGDPRPWAVKEVTDRALLQPDSFAAQLGAAIVEISAGSFDRARANLEVCEKLKPGDPEAGHLLAVLDMRSGRTGQGVERLEMQAVQGSATIPALADLGWAYLETNRGVEALAIYDRIGVQMPGWRELPYRRGLALGKSGREPEGHLELGRYYFDSDPKAAKFHLTKAAQTLPAGVKQDDAKALLERLGVIEREEEARKREPGGSSRLSLDKSSRLR